MKKIIILLLVLGIPLGYAGAQQSAKVLAASERALSYTDGDSITISDICIGKAYTYAIGAWATPQMLRSYAGCKIVGIRFAVGSSIGKSRVFLCRIQNKDVTDSITRKNTSSAKMIHSSLATTTPKHNRWFKTAKAPLPYINQKLTIISPR